MKIGNESSFVDGVPVCEQSVEMVMEFPYLGSTISNDSEMDSDIKIRIAKAASTFGCPSVAYLLLLNVLCTRQ